MIRGFIGNFPLYLYCDVLPRTVFVLFFLFAYLMIVLFRRYFRNFALSTMTWRVVMVAGADRNGAHWTEDNDMRITQAGRLIQKVRLDEVPQLWNILAGNMTFVGPRPEAASLVELCRKEIPYYDERHMVTPGLTGWAQINYAYGNSVDDAREKLKYDLYYIKNRSYILDAIILLRTIRTVLTGKGAL